MSVTGKGLTDSTLSAIRRIPVCELHAAFKAQGVPSREDIAFKCPMCGSIQSINDLVSAGVEPNKAERFIGFSCVGRFNGAGPSTHERTPQPGNYGCDWTLGGLFQLHNLEVIDADGKVHPTFEPASPEEAQAHFGKLRAESPQ